MIFFAVALVYILDIIEHKDMLILLQHVTNRFPTQLDVVRALNFKYLISLTINDYDTPRLRQIFESIFLNYNCYK